MNCKQQKEAEHHQICESLFLQPISLLVGADRNEEELMVLKWMQASCLLQLYPEELQRGKSWDKNLHMILLILWILPC